MKNETMFFTVSPDSITDDQVRIVAFGKDANGEVQIHHINLDNLAWMLAKHQEGKKVVMQETGMQALSSESASGA